MHWSNNGDAHPRDLEFVVINSLDVVHVLPASLSFSIFYIPGSPFRCMLRLFPSNLHHINPLSPFPSSNLCCILGNFFILFFNTLNLFLVILSLLIHPYIDSFYFVITLFIISLCLILCLVSWILILPLFLYFKINFYQANELWIK